MMDTSKKMYKIGIKYLRPEIKEITVVSETDKTVMIEIKPGIGRRQNKKSTYDEIYPTCKEAYERLLQLSRKQVADAETMFNGRMETLRNVEALKCPNTK